MTATRGPVSDRDWSRAPLKDLVGFLVEAQHDCLREELPALNRTVANVASLLSSRQPALILRLHRAFCRLAEEVREQMKKKEELLFPAIIRMDEAFSASQAFPRPTFGSVRNPISMMEQDHQRLAAIFFEIRGLTEDYRLTDPNCEMLRVLCQGLQSLESGLLAQIQLESSILFPRTISLEARLN